MKNQEGIQLTMFPFKKLTLFHHILFYDEPFLSHVQDEDGADYLGLWVDNNDKAHRWLVFRVQPIDLKNYLGKKRALKSLVLSTNNDFIFLADMIDGKYANTLMLKPTNLIPDYIPEEDSFYKSGIDEKYTQFFKQTLSPVSA